MTPHEVIRAVRPLYASGEYSSVWNAICAVTQDIRLRLEAIIVLDSFVEAQFATGSSDDNILDIDDVADTFGRERALGVIDTALAEGEAVA